MSEFVRTYNYDKESKMKMEESKQEDLRDKKKQSYKIEHLKYEQIYHRVSQLSNQDCYKLKEAFLMLELMKHQYLPEKKEIQCIQLILDLFTPKGKFYAVVCVYQYDIIQGKRKLRKQKRNKKNSYH